MWFTCSSKAHGTWHMAHGHSEGRFPQWLAATVTLYPKSTTVAGSIYGSPRYKRPSTQETRRYKGPCGLHGCLGLASIPTATDSKLSDNFDTEYVPECLRVLEASGTSAVLLSDSKAVVAAEATGRQLDSQSVGKGSTPNQIASSVPQLIQLYLATLTQETRIPAAGS